MQFHVDQQGALSDVIVERTLDRIGDDDGLCESSEACVYTSSYGIARVAGPLSTCTFQDGAITGVTLYGR